MRSEGFSFNSGGLEVGVMFSQRCFHDRNRSKHVRSATAMTALSLTVGLRSQNVIRMLCWRSVLANSVFLLRFVTCVAVAFAFCVAGAILWKRVNASISFSRGRRSTLCCCS